MNKHDQSRPSKAYIFVWQFTRKIKRLFYAHTKNYHKKSLKLLIQLVKQLKQKKVAFFVLFFTCVLVREKVFSGEGIAEKVDTILECFQATVRKCNYSRNARMTLSSLRLLKGSFRE